MALTLSQIGMELPPLYAGVPSSFTVASLLRVRTVEPVAACRFYASQGCGLGAIHCHGHARRPGLAREAMLLCGLDV